MNQYETGKHIPDYFTLSRIGKILKVPTAYFYTDDDTLGLLIKNYSRATKQIKKEMLRIK